MGVNERGSDRDFVGRHKKINGVAQSRRIQWIDELTGHGYTTTDLRIYEFTGSRNLPGVTD